MNRYDWRTEEQRLDNEKETTGSTSVQVTAAASLVLFETAAKKAAPGYLEPQHAPGDKTTPIQSADGSITVSPDVAGHHVGLDN